MPRSTDSADAHRAGARKSLFTESDGTPDPDTRASSPIKVVQDERTADAHLFAGLAQKDRDHRKRRRNELDILLSAPNTLEGEVEPALGSSHRNSAYDAGVRQVKQEENSGSNPALDQSGPIARTSSNAEERVNSQLDEVRGRIGTKSKNERLSRGSVPNLGDKDGLSADNHHDEETLPNLSHTESGEPRRRARGESSVNSNSVFEDPGGTSDSRGSGDENRGNTREVAAVTSTEYRPVQHLAGSEPRGQQAPLPGQANIAGPISTYHQLGARPFENNDRTISTSVETTMSPAPAMGNESRKRVLGESILATSTNNDPTSRRTRTEEEDSMNEDERLLASEEGKKLSSKDRRRLRNKISAKAHRSRRRGTCSLFVH